MQIINVALWGSLHPDHSVLPAPADRHRGGELGHLGRGREGTLWEKGCRWSTPPTRSPSPRKAGSPARLEAGATVNSYHHQSIATLGEGVVVAATAPDGVIEAIEVPAAPALCIAVQWEVPGGTRQPAARAVRADAAAERAAAPAI